MTNKREYFRDLFRNYLNDQYSERELRELMEWLRTDQAGEQTNDLTKELWNTIPLNRKENSSNEVQALREESLQITQLKVRKEKKNTKYFFQTIYKVAAVAMVFLLAGSFYHFYFNKGVREAEVFYQNIVANPGEIRHIELPDGSSITLNAGSKLYIPEDFNRKERNIILDGEAFFDVFPDPQKSFNVKGGSTSIQVLGTSFNVKAYNEDQHIAVTVSSGKVRVDIEEMETRLNLTPNQHLVINRVSGDFEKKTVEENMYVKWMNGVLYFEKESLDEVIRKLQRCYDKEVILQINPDRKFAITGTHDNKSLESVLESVCFTAGLSYTQKENRIIITE